ncbi:MAG: hypothetical protein M1821_003909 [Bathelium mastoideum]|nr:MAG: hypothetical protein M1821_003909 [Bathelium mastoideum]
MVGTTINGSRDRSFGQSSTKSPKPTTKDSLTFRTLELGKIRQPFSSSSTDNQLDFHGESDGFAILDRSGGDNRLSDEEQAGIQITTDISVKSEQDEPVQGTFSRTESDGEIERGGPLG